MTIDGSSLGNPRPTDFGGLLRNGDGVWRQGFFGNLGISNKLHAKLLPIHHRHVEVDDTCRWYTSFSESSPHLFIFSAKDRACWDNLGIFPLLNYIATSHASFGAVFFAALNALTGNNYEAWCMTLWSLWQSRNTHIWENKHEDCLSKESVAARLEGCLCSEARNRCV